MDENFKIKVEKRDGRLVEFNIEKVSEAIRKSMKRTSLGVDEGLIEKIQTNLLNSKLYKEEKVTVEDIQDFIEKELMKSSRKDVAKEYIVYRENRNKIRESKSKLIKEVATKLKASNVENQNANVDEKSFGGRIGEASRVVTKEYALNNCMSKMSRENHLNNEIYIHDLDSYAVGSHNCYIRSTRFITSEGIKSFNDYCDGDSVKILSKDGKWRDAVVHFYGRQPMYELTLSRCGISKTVVVTRNHRWLLNNGQFTDNIQVGDSIYPLNQMEKIEITNKRQAEMFALGFILGDGYDHNGYLEAKFCNSEKESYIDIFIQAGYHVGFCNSYKYVTKKSNITKQDFLSQKMWRILSFEDKRFLFEGYLAADGSKTTDTKYLWTSDKRMCELIEDISALDGYHIFKKKTINNNTNYKNKRTLYEYTFTTKYSSNSTWKVVDIQKGSHRNKDYEAWCLEEPETHTFTLEGGVVTGNCLSIPFDDLLKNGFNTRQVDIRPAGSINTAFQLIAVIFQLQSLQQFGGVSATHLDWTMVPYVRKSFYKHYIDGIEFIDSNVNLEIDKDKAVDVSIEDAKYKKNDKIYNYAIKQTIKELDQAVEGMYHNLNSLQSRSGNQLPFTSINYGTCTSPEGRLVTKALLDGSIKGVGKFHRTSIFPCSIFQCMKGVNRKPGDPNYDLFQLALKSTSLRLYPNYANVDWSGNAGYDINDPRTYFSTMGKRKLQPI